MFKNILIPTDGSPLSQKAAIQGVALAKSVGAKVTGFFAAPPATPIVYRNHLPVGFAQPGEHEQMIEKTAAEASRCSSSSAAKKAGVPFEGVHVTNDFPADAILDDRQQEEVRSHRHGDAGPGRLARRVHRQRHAEGAEPGQSSGNDSAMIGHRDLGNVVRRTSC